MWSEREIGWLRVVLMILCNPDVGGAVSGRTGWPQTDSCRESGPFGFRLGFCRHHHKLVCSGVWPWCPECTVTFYRHLTRADLHLLPRVIDSFNDDNHHNLDSPSRRISNPDFVDVEIPHTAGVASSHESTPSPVRIVVAHQEPVMDRTVAM